ncbi:M48 family metalloprotease [Paenibacillus sp. NPDC056579]|uniref:M48 family metalloprotease n=1 Tax=Paenibacillus sp. NPDC056579 TaxID=3345871 RepID=UPI003698DCDE
MGIISDLSIMFPKKNDPSRHQKLFSDFKNLLIKLNMRNNIGLKVYKDPLYNGIAGNEKYILISDSLVRLYDQNPAAVRCMMAHELTHVKYRDFGLYKAMIGFGVAFGVNYCRAINLLMEIRAEVEAYRINQFTSEEFKVIHNTFKQHNTNSKKIKSYEVGYPDRDSTVELCIKHKKFSSALIDELLMDFCMNMNVENSEKLIKNVKKKFIIAS